MANRDELLALAARVEAENGHFAWCPACGLATVTIGRRRTTESVVLGEGADWCCGTMQFVRGAEAAAALRARAAGEEG